jgi:hypothetical protein
LGRLEKYEIVFYVTVPELPLTAALAAQTSLISQAQPAALQPRRKPGDVLLVRSEWFLSNVSLPRFWPHAA